MVKNTTGEGEERWRQRGNRSVVKTGEKRLERARITVAETNGEGEDGGVIEVQQNEESKIKRARLAETETCAEPRGKNIRTV